MNDWTEDSVVRSRLALCPRHIHPSKGSESMQTKHMPRSKVYLRSILKVAISMAVLGSGCAARHARGRSSKIPMGPVAPNFVARAASGGTLRLTNARGRWLALFFFCGCQSCKETASHLACLARRLRSGSVWAVTELNPADVRSFARTTRMRFPVILDPDASVKQAFAVERCPTVVLVNKEGTIESRWSTGAAGELGRITTSVLWRTLEAQGDR
jgi:peroxiredoxin